MSKKPKPAAVAVPAPAPVEDPITKEIEALVASEEVKELREKVEAESVTSEGNEPKVEPVAPRKPVIVMDDDASAVSAAVEAALPKVEAPVVEAPKASVPAVKQVSAPVPQKTVDEMQRGAELVARYKAR